MKKILFKTPVLMAVAALLMASCGKADSDTIKIGGIFPLSGKVAVYGVDCRNGIVLALEEINNAGGINGKKLSLISEDDEGDPEKTVNAYKKLITKDKVTMIIGSLTSGCTKAITAQAQAKKVVLMAPAATEPSITEAGDFIFRACYTDPFQGSVGGLFAVRDLGAKNAAILYDNGNPYSTGLTSNFVRSFESEGGIIAASESYNSSDVDFNAQITKIKAANPDAVYLPDYYSTVSLVAKQLRAQGVTVPIVGADGWDGIVGDKAGDEILNGFYSNHYAPDSTDPKVINFVNSYKSMFKNTVPTSFAALGYDSLYLLKDALVKAGNSGANSEAVKNALAAINGVYLTGNLSFDANHNPVKSAVIVEIVKGEDGKLTTQYKTRVDP